MHLQSQIPNTKPTSEINSNHGKAEEMKILKALILVGGFGTRLRPFTLSMSKPLVPFMNKPMVVHQIEALAKAGVSEVVLAVNNQNDQMTNAMQKYAQELDVKITFSVEKEPLGTAGPLALAADILREGNQPFFVLNSDISCDFPFAEMLEEHKHTGAMGTLLVTKVSEPSKYGVIVTQGHSSKIEAFVEKPAEFISNRINAGIYVLSPQILDLIPLGNVSIEKETFPLVAQKGALFLYDLQGYWMDVGQPKDYLIGTGLYLEALAHKNPKILSKSKGYSVQGNVLIDPSAVIGKNCLIGPNVVIGPNVQIGEGVRLSKCTLMEGTVVKENTLITNSIIGWKCHIGSWVRIEGMSVLGEDVTVSNELFVNGACVLPHKSISSNVHEPKIIL